MTGTLAPPRPPEPNPAAPRLGSRPAAALAIFGLVLALVGLPGRDLFTVPTWAVLVEGPLESMEAGEWHRMKAGDEVPEGVDLRVGSEPVQLRFRDDGTAMLTAGARFLADRGDVLLTRGSILLDGVEAGVVVGAVRATGTGTWRADANGRARIATYAGEVLASDGASRRELPRYAQVVVRDAGLEGEVAPLRYDADDPFDAAELAEAFRIDALAAALGRSLTATYGQAPRMSDFYAAFVPDGDDILARLGAVSPVVAGDRFGPPADVLLAVVAVDALAKEGRLLRSQAVAVVASLRSAGATWGVVLLRHDGTAADLRSAADRAFARAAEDPPPLAPPPEPVPAPAQPPAAPGPASGPAQPAPSPGAATSDPDPPDEGGPLAPVGDLVRETGDLLAGVVETVTDAVGGVVDTVDELLRPGRGLLGGG